MKLLRKMNGLTLMVLLIGFCLTAGIAEAVPFINGSFETGVDPGVGILVGAGDSTSITGWTVTTGNIEYYGTYWQAADGGRSLDMNGSVPGAISQIFDTIPDAYYEVRFAMAGNPDGCATCSGDPPGPKELRVSAGDESSDYVFDSTGKSRTNMGWVNDSFFFTADGTATNLTFTSLHTPSQYTGRGAAIDDVSVNLIHTPEPASVLLLGSGLLASFLGLGRKRRKK